MRPSLIVTLLTGLVLAAPSVASTPSSAVDVELLFPDGRLECKASGNIDIQPRHGRITGICDDGREIACTAAPWDWTYDPAQRLLLAACERNPDAGFIIEVNPATQQGTLGGSVTWQIRVRNTGPGALQAIAVTTTPTTSGCNRNFASLNAGSTITYTCALLNITGTTTVQFAGAATRAGAPATTSASAVVNVAATPPPPGRIVSVEICRTPEHQVVGAGQAATWEIKVRNNGDLPFSSVQVVDDIPSNCGRTIGQLLPGAQFTYNCSRLGGGPYVATLSATGTEAEQGFRITAAIDTVVQLDPIFRGRFGSPPTGH